MRVLFAAIVAVPLAFPSMASAAKVNCSYAACLKECTIHRSGSPNGCSHWCSDAMTERQNAGQCPRK